MEQKTFKHPYGFALELGGELSDIQLSYNTLGQLNAESDNVVWICHALTGNANPTEWWDGLVGEGKFFNPETHFIICANVIGSNYGSTNALAINAKKGEAYYHDFPNITTRDVVNAFDLLREELGIHQIQTCIGGSLGGQQAVEWAINQPNLIQNLILIATNAFHSPWGIAFNESQRMAIQADPTWRNRQPNAGIEGMKVARSIALLSYRNYDTYNFTQARDSIDQTEDFRASSYQIYQGDKLAARFNAFAYWTLSKMMDSHNVGRNRGSVISALQKIQSKTLVIGIHSDILFPPAEQQFLAKHIPNADYQEIDSLYGHDGFLIEYRQLRQILRGWFERQR